MRRIWPLAITFAALSLSTTGVRADGTWCAHYGTGLEGMNCGFYSFEQCRATVSGVGGFCQANLSSAHAAQRNRDGIIGATISTGSNFSPHEIRQLTINPVFQEG